jgi:hypothetical protein
MSRRRWTIWLGPPVALAAIALVLARFQPGAEAGGRATVVGAATCTTTPARRDVGGKVDLGVGQGTWWALSERLDGNGALVGRQLALGRGGATRLTMDLAADAMASGPAGGLVALTSDDGQRSQVRLVSAEQGCEFLVREVQDLARGAIVDPVDGSLIVHLVDRRSRADLGTWRYAADGTGEPVIVAPPLEANAERGPNWITDLRFDASATRLAVQSCTAEGCLTRLFEMRRGLVPVARVDAAQGALIGAADGRLVTWEPCDGLPCGVVSWDLGGGSATTILEHAESAALTSTGRFVIGVADSSRGSIVRFDLTAGKAVALRGLNANERFVGGGVVGTSGIQVGADEVGVAAAGAVPRPFSAIAAEVLP